MILTQLVGFVAACLTTIAFLPQVIKTWRSKSVKDISLPMFLILCTGVFLWLVYGIIRQDLPIILANAFTFLLAGSILYCKVAYRD